MRRRTFLGRSAASALLLLGPGMARAAEVGPKEIRPYREVGPFREDADAVLIFFDFACGHCRSYHTLLSNWGPTLPQRYLKPRFVPVVVSKDDIVAAAAFYAYESKVKGDRTRLLQFMEKAYTAIQDRQQPKGDPWTWRRLAAAPMQVDDKIRDRVVAAGGALQRYAITHTPSMALGGRYVITPDHAGGNPQMFLQLMNGVASMVLAEKGYRGA